MTISAAEGAARPLGLEFLGALYHVTSRGDRREPTCRDHADGSAHLQVIAAGMDRFDSKALGYCLMANHFHRVVHTQQANLSRLMRQLNGVYTQAFNRRHGLVGHLLQGRFKAILVDRDPYLMSRAGTSSATAWRRDWWRCRVTGPGRAIAPTWGGPMRRPGCTRRRFTCNCGVRRRRTPPRAPAPRIGMRPWLKTRRPHRCGRAA